MARGGRLAKYSFRDKWGGKVALVSMRACAPTVTLGLPAEGIGILIAVDAIPDLFATMLNTTGDLAAAALVAR